MPLLLLRLLWLLHDSSLYGRASELNQMQIGVEKSVGRRRRRKHLDPIFLETRAPDNNNSSNCSHSNSDTLA